MESFCEYVKFFSPSLLFIRVLGLFGRGPLGLVVILWVETIMVKRLPPPPQYIDGRPRDSLIPSFPGPFVTISMIATPKTNRSVNPPCILVAGRTAEPERPGVWRNHEADTKG